MRLLFPVALVAAALNIVVLPSSAAAAGGLCPADVGVGEIGSADPWLLTSDVETYPGLRDVDANGDGYVCAFDPVLITLTTIVVDDVRAATGGGFRLMSMDQVRNLANANVLEEAMLADRNGNGQVLVDFIEGEPDRPILIDNLWDDR
jgi:hypothetical protein